MPRPLTVICLILLGALGSGASLGFVLYQVGQEHRVAQARVHSLEAELEQLQTANEKLAFEANRKVDAAGREIKKAQEIVKSFQNERIQLIQAIPLSKPDKRALKTWAEAFSVPLGVSLRLPPGTRAYTHERGLVAMLQESADQDEQTPWLSISPYQADQEQYLITRLEEISQVSFLIAGNLVTGVRGKRTDGALGYTYVLRVQGEKDPSHLIWVRSEPSVSEEKIQTTLATLSFRS